jgi:Na+/H+ antiporter NhaC
MLGRLEAVCMLSALVMLRRVARAFGYAVREENFGPVFSAGAALVLIGTITYTLGQDWNPVDSLYFLVSTLTTTSVSDPDLVLQDGWAKVFTVLYQIIGIGLLVEILRRMGAAFVTVQAEEKRAKSG